MGRPASKLNLPNQKKEPNRLISLPLLSIFDLRPNVNEDWDLEGFWWRGQKNFYAPGELLYFTNNSLESDYEGISDIEPVLDDVRPGRRSALKTSRRPPQPSGPASPYTASTSTAYRQD